MLLLLVMVMGVGEMWGQSLPFEVTTAEDITNHTEKLYWMESVGATGFYAVPHSNNTNASTTNAPTLRALWYFMESGEDGYYYIINKETGTYLKKTGAVGSDNTIGVATYANADDSKFKFSFDTPQGITQGSWVIYPKEAGTTGWLSKKSGNLQYNLWLKVSNFGSTPVGDLNSQWKIVARDAVQWPQSGLPFVVSTNSEKHYYCINHAQNTSYNVSYDGSNYVTISNELDNKTAWYFEEAASDPNIDNLKYYYIVNAPTGKYLKFTSTTINGNNQTNAFTLSDYSAGDADRFQFVVVNSYGGNAGYSIMPKLAMSKYDAGSNFANSMVPNSVGNNKKLDLRSDRNNNNAHWNFVITEYPMSCSISSITYDSSTGKITITRSPSNADIHYTLDGTTEPTSSIGTLYSAPFSVSSSVTIKAIATKDGYVDSEVATATFDQVATPTIQNNGLNAVSITCATEGATIYYTTNGDNPTTSSTQYTGPLRENVSGVTIKAIAVKDGWVNSAVNSGSVTLQCAKPTITKIGDNVTITCNFPSSGVSIYYTLDGGEPSSSSTPYSAAISVSIGDVIKAIAIASGYDNSPIATKTIYDNLTPTDGKYLINSQADFDVFADMANTTEGAAYHYVLKTDVEAGAEILEPFTGVFEVEADANGNFHKIIGLSHTLFNTINGGVVKNVMLDNVAISGSGNVGAICNEAGGDTRIYNCGILATSSTVEKDDDGYDYISSCSSSISGSGYVGGIVGLLDGSSRVINCFSYANITGGDYVGGIVGYNKVATNTDSEDTDHYLKTMVMNCMFYGNITGGTNKAPIYNGENIINKEANGVSNFNYFLADATFTGGIDNYNCALMAETRYLQRFEFFRQLLNSHRELAGWWATGTFSKTEMAKWVMEPSQIGSSTPYPILKTHEKYASVVNYTPSETAYDEEHRNEGRKLTSEGDEGVLHVTIDLGTNGGSGAQYAAPSGADFKEGEDGKFDLTITDKDFEHFNFNYGKVQLPYYNDYCDGNYTGNRVVTGWKIVSITVNGTTTTTGTGGWSTSADATATVSEEGEITLLTPYNFADRGSTKKDLYGVSGRVFNQGAYWDVPKGVTAITIEPYWAKCVYLADAYADVVYSQDMKTPYNVPDVGGGNIYTNGSSYSIAGENQVVYTTMSNAISSNNSTGLFVGIVGDANNHTVYDYAVVLVGNYHNYNSIESSNSKPYTVTSIDLDGDNEPDYSYILRFDDRKKVHPVRVDFLNVPGLGMAQKSTGSTGSYNFGIMQPISWFEVTNTALFRVTQLEYEHNDRAAKPLILHGGVIEQWVSGQSGGNGQRTTYIHAGSNVWFKEFHLGCHQDATLVTKHPPVSVTGGDYNEFYLTGLYSSADNCDDNAECYINGGRFDKVAGTGIEGIGNVITHENGNIVWHIQNADIEEFYGGGINATKPIEGSITTVITGSHVKRFCGGPKFGDMNSGKTVITTATDCTFGSFFGAGYGGNSYNRVAPGNFTNQSNYSWNDWIAGKKKGNVVPAGSSAGDYPGGVTYGGYKQDYIPNFGGVSTRFDYQFLPQSNNEKNVGRLFIDFINFSLATTSNVTSTLTGCTITGNFYGGGSLGKVDGNVTSTLTDCTVRGNVFGGGYDATRPTVQVMSTDGFLTPPNYNENTGVFFPAAEPYNTSIEYTWEHRETVNSTETAIDKDNHILYTTEDLTTLGQVTGDVTLNILGNTLVEGQAIDYEGNLIVGNRGGVFGGGDASAVLGNTTVTINATALQAGATYNAYCVYGGGNIAPVGGNSTVTLKGNTQVLNNVFGGGNEGPVEGNATVNIGEEEEVPSGDDPIEEP